MTTALAQNNIGNNNRLSTEQIVQLVSEVVCFSRLANLSWSDEANAFKPFISNDIIVKSIYEDGEPDIVYLFERFFINAKDYYRINPNLPKWVTSIMKKLVFKAGFSITTETFEDFINQISTNLNYE